MSWPAAIPNETVYILDEPTAACMWPMSTNLVKVLDKLVDAGNTVIVIEHNLDVIKRADYIIDLGPEGGSGNGHHRRHRHPEEGRRRTRTPSRGSISGPC